MDNTLLITCQKCGYMIFGRAWRCPGCGGASDKHGTVKRSNTGQNSKGLLAAVVSRIRNKA